MEESKLPVIRTGQTVEVVLEALGARCSGRITEVVPAVDAAARAYTVKIDLPRLTNLRGGEFGRAALVLGTRAVTAIPASALIERGQVQSVYVVEDGTARARLVTTGRRWAGSAETLSGLSAGERVIAPIPASLAEGTRVEVRP